MITQVADDVTDDDGHNTKQELLLNAINFAYIIVTCGGGRWLRLFLTVSQPTACDGLTAWATLYEHT